MNYGFVRFLREVSQVARKRSVLLAGNDGDLKREALYLLFQALKGVSIEIEHLGENKPASLVQVTEALSESPLIGLRRVIVVWHIEKTGLKAWSELARDADADVMTYAVSDEEVEYKDLPVDVVVVCDSVNAGTKEFDRYTDQVLVPLGKRLSDDARAHLHVAFASQTHALPRELLKVALFVGERPEITRDDLVQALWSHRTQRVFDLVDAVVRRSLPHAMGLWQEAWTEGVEPSSFFHVLAQRLQWIEGAYRAQETGEGLKEYAKRRKIPYHLLEKVVDGLKHIKRQHMVRFVDVLCEAEARVRVAEPRYQRHLVDKTIVALCT